MIPIRTPSISFSLIYDIKNNFLEGRNSTFQYTCIPKKSWVLGMGMGIVPIPSTQYPIPNFFGYIPNTLPNTHWVFKFFF